MIINRKMYKKCVSMKRRIVVEFIDYGIIIYVFFSKFKKKHTTGTKV